jgi:hypothetical protein
MAKRRVGKQPLQAAPDVGMVSNLIIARIIATVNQRMPEKSKTVHISENWWRGVFLPFFP